MRDRLKQLGVEPEKGWGSGKLLLELFEKTAEDKLTGPVFVTQLPHGGLALEPPVGRPARLYRPL